MEKFEDNISENEDDPEVYESSGDEWNEIEEEKKKRSRRTSQRLSKKPRVTHAEDSSDSESGEPKKRKSKNGIKRQKLEEDVEGEEEEGEDEEGDEEENDEDLAGDSADTSSPQSNNKGGKKSSGISSKRDPDFVNGGFLILKKDAQLGDSNKKPCLWRIDGKALLQKYEPFDEAGKLRHRTTSIYTGWSSLDKDLYYPLSVRVIQHQGQNMTIEVDWDKLKEVCNESE